ncbi:tail fiber protein [Desulforamulus aeronauticus]|uniref:Phage tail fibre repeat-containing protein n=1 Tax=Desulforamulus aeronauticus DSM 10349 TaxID=1121421 RepID=A0A1M6WHB0_9FIRM|nr:tail fiber protein [Desulforamulus aeronauticus]SHK93078.1 Phage tail fibre repeat-containing protein [Desulforamulus aeronauticus DSM 10349]
MANYNIELKKRNTANTGWDSLYPITQAANVVMQDGKSVEQKVSEHLAETASTVKNGHVQLNDAVNSTSTTTAATANAVKKAYDKAEQAFTQASDGKTQVATAITGKGVSATGGDTFSQLATKIGQINTGVTPAGTAVAGDVLASKTFINSGGTVLTGTMVNRGAITITPSATDQNITAGYHSGAGKVSAVVVPAANVLTGTTIAGTAGTMVNRSGGWHIGTFIGNNPTVGTLIKPPAGYYDGATDSYVYVKSNDLIPENIKQGLNIFGVTGTLPPADIQTIWFSDWAAIPLVRGQTQTGSVNFNVSNNNPADWLGSNKVISIYSNKGYDNAVVTDLPVNLTGINKVGVLMKCNGDCYFIASTNKMGEYTEYDAMLKIAYTTSEVTNTSTFMKLVKLDVSALSGYYYIRLHAYQPSTYSAVDVRLGGFIMK